MTKANRNDMTLIGNQMKKLLTILSIACLFNASFVLSATSQDNSAQTDAQQIRRVKKKRKDQPPQQREMEFVLAKPTIGDTIPEVSILDAHGNLIQTSSLRGKYVVLTFGCLT